MSDGFQILIVSFLPMAFFSVLGFWKSNSLCFMLAAGSAMVAGFNWYDVDTTPRGLGIALMIWAYSIVCLGFAFMCIFKKEPTD